MLKEHWGNKNTVSYGFTTSVGQHAACLWEIFWSSSWNLLYVGQGKRKAKQLSKPFNPTCSFSFQCVPLMCYHNHQWNKAVWRCVLSFRWVVTDLQVAFSLVLKCSVWSVLSSTILVMPLCFKTEECRDGPCISYEEGVNQAESLLN